MQTLVLSLMEWNHNEKEEERECEKKVNEQNGRGEQRKKESVHSENEEIKN